MSAAAYNTNYLDVSPHYAGQLFSIGNTIANITGIVTPIITGNILGDKDFDFDNFPFLCVFFGSKLALSLS